MIEKVNPKHPDKIADRIAGALVDMAYANNENPRIAVEVLIGHRRCFIIAETSVHLDAIEVSRIVDRITDGFCQTHYIEVKQDEHLAENQSKGIRCGDNGIFKGMPLTDEQREMSRIAREIYDRFGTDGKYILAGKDLIICQSHATEEEIISGIHLDGYNVKINPLGYWTGGINVDTGAVNRKLGSDMADSVTGGGLHGKDLSKADVSLNICAFKRAQETGKPVEIYCAIGDEKVGSQAYTEFVEEAREYIKSVGGFEKFAEWGLY